MMRRVLVATGLILLALLWGGPLMRASQQDFAAHMAVHMGLVAVVAPLLAAVFLQHCRLHCSQNQHQLHHGTGTCVFKNILCILIS